MTMAGSSRWQRTHDCGRLRLEHEGQQVTLKDRKSVV